jgi:hypothetical protein
MTKRNMRLKGRSPSLHHSTTPLLHYSTTPLLHYSTTPLLHYLRLTDPAFVGSVSPYRNFYVDPGPC